MVSNIPLYNSLKEVLGDTKAHDVHEFIEPKVDDRYLHWLTHTPTLEQTTELKGDIRCLQLELKKDIAELRTLIAETNASTVKWVVGVFLAGFLSLIGLVVGLYFK
jgi:hypothetical protein